MINLNDFDKYLEQVRILADEKFEELIEETEKTNRFCDRFFDLIKEYRFYELSVPKEYGGAGFSAKKLALVQEAFSRGPGGMRMYLHYILGMNIRLMLDFANDMQKKEYLKKLAKGDMLTSFCLTEKTGGTGEDLHTKAIRQDDGSFILNGEKTLISYALYASHGYVFANLEEVGITCFLVPFDSEGVTIKSMSTPLGCHGAGYGTIEFNNVKLDKDSVIGTEGKGVKQAVGVLSLSRVFVAISNLGLCKRMLECSVKRANERKTFGKALSTRQMIKSYLADMATYIHALDTMINEYITDYDNGIDNIDKSAMIKDFSITVSRIVSDNMLLIFGGIGYFCDNEYGPIERMYRDCRVTWLEEGPPSVMKLTVTRGF